MKKLLLLVAATALAFGASAKVVLPKVLGSNMVLQQNADVNLGIISNNNAAAPGLYAWALFFFLGYTTGPGSETPPRIQRSASQDTTPAHDRPVYFVPLFYNGIRACMRRFSLGYINTL